MSEFAEGLAVGMNENRTGSGIGNGFGDGWWILLLLLCCMGGFGNWGGNGFGGNEFPWLMNGQNSINNNTNDMLRFTQINDSLNSISQQLYANELASLNRSFDAQTATTQGFTNVQSGLCDIRYGAANNTRDIIEAQTRGTQAILDKLCALEIDGYKRENDQLRAQLNMANLAASQTAQTAELRTSQATVANQLVSELRSCPIPSQPVYGSTPIFSASGTCGCSGT